MKHLLSFLFLLQVVFIIVSCNEKETFDTSKLQDVMRIYTDSSELKIKSAQFLIENMSGHYFYNSIAIDAYTDLVLRTDTLKSSDMCNWWDSLNCRNHVK